MLSQMNQVPTFSHWLVVVWIASQLSGLLNHT
ncbi:hypothetical protein VPHK479_0071 [Vibrio phage K479]